MVCSWGEMVWNHALEHALDQHLEQVLEQVADHKQDLERTQKIVWQDLEQFCDAIVSRCTTRATLRLLWLVLWWQGKLHGRGRLGVHLFQSGVMEHTPGEASNGCVNCGETILHSPFCNYIYFSYFGLWLGLNSEVLPKEHLPDLANDPLPPDGGFHQSSNCLLFPDQIWECFTKNKQPKITITEAQCSGLNGIFDHSLLSSAL